MPCEDIVRYDENGEFVTAALADGATCCRHSLTGAQCAAEAAIDMVNTEKDRLFTMSETKIGRLLIRYILMHLQKKGVTENELSEYGSTLLAAAVRKSDRRALLLKLGNGKCLAAGNERLCDPFMYRSAGGLKALTTDRCAFAAVRARTIIPEQNNGIFMCTDGFEKMVFETFRCSVEAVQGLMEPNASGNIMQSCTSGDDAAFLIICGNAGRNEKNDRPGKPEKRT